MPTTEYINSGWWTGRVSLADLDGDGDLDVVSPGGILLGNGDGTFGGSNVPIGSDGVADFDGDGNLDVAISGVLADFNGDGASDLATAGSSGPDVRLGDGYGALRPAIHFDAGYTPGSVTAADFDGDGLPDLAATGYDPSAGSYVASIFVNDGSWPAADAPLIAIADATVIEGNGGTVAVSLTVSLSAACSEAVTVEYVTADDVAAASSDYQAASGTLTIDVGDTSGTLTVLVNGDRLFEGDETFVVHLVEATNAFLDDTQATATIVDDEPRLSITPSVSKAEGGRHQKTLFPFVVTLSSAYDEAVSVSFQTRNGTAGNSDYVGSAGSLTFTPGQTSKTIAIEVKGDDRREPDETFSLSLYGPSSNSSLTFPYGRGTILNDD